MLAINPNKNIKTVESNNNLICKLVSGDAALLIGFIMVLITPLIGGVLIYYSTTIFIISPGV